MTKHAPQINAPRFIDDLKTVLYGAVCIGMVYGTRACIDSDAISLTDETPEGKIASAELSNAVSLLAKAAVSLISRAYTSCFRVRMQSQNDEQVEQPRQGMR